ncbi:adenylate cyclase type 3 [Caerostris extrusa]|uniref:adenylate cyclase n=1 Tax=Caerostris extrusa TaxID=172846 RepID=A0AAV4WA83_CAEEX|nr:adenylate cyclase type 3 [Caerostris extrusa]
MHPSLLSQPFDCFIAPSHPEGGVLQIIYGDDLVLIFLENKTPSTLLETTIFVLHIKNCRILFADIVGFTAISSTCTAPELVKILNELFARFDKLSDKYHQLRIKILGDCYYCISGAPEERPDHAVLCVHMGLSMVDAIKSVREKTNTNVDMRVGVHTGAILAGVMGQRQWQFDVYSRDVVLANKMESAGMPGRVHISDKTLGFLKGEFEVTPGDGMSREEALRSAGLETYFITKVLKPYPMGTLDEKTEQNGKSGKDDELSRLTGNGDKTFEEDYKARLHEELLGREKKGHIRQQANPLTLFFKDPKLETEFRKIKDTVSLVSISGLPVISFFAPPPISWSCRGEYKFRSVFAIICLPSGSLLLALIAIIFICPAGLEVGPSFLKRIGRSLIEKPGVRLTIIIVMIIVWCVMHILSTDYENTWTWPRSLTLVAVNGSNLTTGFINLNLLQDSLDYYDDRTYGISDHDMSHSITLTVIVIVVSLCLILINRQLEVTSRRLFLWQKEVEEQREMVADMRVKNEALVYNILPPHVAKHFLGQSKKDEQLDFATSTLFVVHLDLQSHFLKPRHYQGKSYEAVGVLFAAMPNFSDFYTEDSVNNQGLECLRFLNEVISVLTPSWSSQDLRISSKLKLLVPHIWQQVVSPGPHHGRCDQSPEASLRHVGNTVNVSSRMESTGKAGCIQVVEETARILEEFDYVFEQRGLVAVKGKGNLMTYYLLGRKSDLKNSPVKSNLDTPPMKPKTSS